MQSNPINTIPLQQFIQQVKIADMSQQKEIKLDIKTAKQLAFTLGEVTSKLTQDYDKQKSRHLEKLADKMLENDEKIRIFKEKKSNGKFLDLF